jgi:uncharacterized membrane protein
MILAKRLDARLYFSLVIAIILITDLAIALNIPFLRQIIGFLFLTILPGLLVLQILKLNKLGFTEKFVLSIGLSISFLIFFGLLINNLSLTLGYLTPLSTISLLISFNTVLITLAIIGYKVNKNSVYSLPNPNLTTSEKAFLIIPILFPALSIFGMHVMNLTANNIILMLLLFLIPAYVVFVCIFNQKFPPRLYPVVIFLISISLLLLMSLRSNHLIGSDTHREYYFFWITFDNLHWCVLTTGTPLDACLGISILPTVYQSLLNMCPEFLFKILYSSLFSISPLGIYVLSKRYIGESYGFLASCFFMFQIDFLRTTANSRTSLAQLFVVLAIMVLLSDKIEPLKKRVLFIVFMASCMVSHYGTTYIFFFILLGTFVGVEVLSKKYTFKKVVSLTIVILFFALIFFWYSQVTETTFNAGVYYIENTISNLNLFFVEESRGATTYSVLGEDIMQKGIPHRIEFVFTWLTFVLIGMGVITLLIKRKEMSFPELNFKKAEFLKEKFEAGYFVITLACAGLLVAMVALPYVSQHYSLGRLYAVGITILSVFFVIGGITLSKHFFFFTKRKLVLKEKQSFTKRSNYLRNNGKNGSQVRAYLIILLVLIPYFLCVTGVTYQMFGYPRRITLDSEGETYDKFFVHDQESCGAKWLEEYREGEAKIYTDCYGDDRLLSQAHISSDPYSLVKNRTCEGYIYLRYYAVVDGKLLGPREPVVYIPHTLSDYSHQFVAKSKIYANGGSEVYK